MARRRPETPRLSAFAALASLASLAPRSCVAYAPRTMSTGGVLGVLVVVALAVGCGPNSYNPGPETCDRSEENNPPVEFTGGTTEDGVYMTSAWDGELLYFPGGMHYELVHGLGTVPRFFQGYLSFDRHGTDDGGTLGVASGNQVELVRADDDSLVVKNAECVDYWLLVVAGAGAPPSP